MFSFFLYIVPSAVSCGPESYWCGRGAVVGLLGPGLTYVGMPMVLGASAGPNKGSRGSGWSLL